MHEVEHSLLFGFVGDGGGLPVVDGAGVYVAGDEADFVLLQTPLVDGK